MIIVTKTNTGAQAICLLFFRHSAQNSLDNRQVNCASFANSDEKNWLRICGTIFVRYCLKERSHPFSTKKIRQVEKMKEAYEYYPECQCGREEGCEKSVKHFMELSIPVDIKPMVKTGSIESECCGEPTVICEGHAGSSEGCRLIITQRLCVKIPLSYGIDVKTGTGLTECCGCND